MLQITNFSVAVEGKTILHDINISFELGKNYCILGKNGSGKSSLAMSIMGHPSYEILQGDVTVDGENINEEDPNEKSQKGVFLAFQSIPEIKGIKVFEFLRTVYSEKMGKEYTFVAFKKIVLPLFENVGLDKELLWRDLNVGFSGGERRKLEVVQISLLKPKYIFLDEIDSGLDVDAFRKVADLVSSCSGKGVSLIIVTHMFTILDYLHIDKVFVLEKGKLINQGDSSLAEKIKKDGFS